ncbi:spectrin beta chain, non-erythrocytic 1-like isoform X4 [Branchiostoma floridae x Branchiostoma belcheri]
MASRNSSRRSSAADSSRRSSMADLQEAKELEAEMEHKYKALQDEREMVQKKTFTKWVNSHLARVNCRITDLYTDLRDGRMLLKLLEILSGERLPRPTRGKMRIHCLENCDKSLQFLKEQRVHLENMGSHDIVDGNQRLTLGLIWTIILRFQIQDIRVDEEETKETRSAKDALLLWCQMKTAGYNNVNITNFTRSWSDGLAFNALIHKHRPDLIDYDKLQKSNAMHNLNNAFNTAERNLGLAKLLDPEDVNVEYPDEKSIITYVVTYYHYFSQMKDQQVKGKRIGKMVQSAIDNENMIQDYETMASDLLKWIEQTIVILNDRTFANSLQGVQQQLLAFNTYRTVEKPPKFMEKGNLEVLLFTLQSKMRANNQKPYTPKEGKLVSDINKAWERLERSEHEREIALREELMRQEKLEQLARRFDRKAAMRETWLSENQRLVSQMPVTSSEGSRVNLEDNFGFDLPAVEAATKKHEAIETDINAYEERVQAVMHVAEELETENYHDIERINARKDNILRLWAYLLELLKARRGRLEASLSLQRIFQEMLYIMDWMDEMKVRLTSEDYGKHLMGVEDLLQKHQLMEADIAVQADRVKAVNDSAAPFARQDDDEYKPADPQIVGERMSHLEASYQELVALAAERRGRLEESRKLWQFFWDMAEEEGWIKEKAAVLASPEIGHDVTSVNLLVNKHKALEREMQARREYIDGVIGSGEELIEQQHFGAGKIRTRINEVNTQWDELEQLAEIRKKRLHNAVDLYQFFADADDVENWILDTQRLVGSEDVGRDEASVQSLIKKQQAVAEELNNYQTNISQLHDQAKSLGEEDQKLIHDLQDKIAETKGERDSPDVENRLATVDQRYKELLEMAKLRKLRLEDALALHKLFTEADGVEAWIDEKEQMLNTMEFGNDIEELEVVRHRFEGLEQEMNAQASRVAVVNQLGRQLLQNQHPNSNEIMARQNQLNSRWAALRELVDAKKEDLNSAMGIQNFHIECNETISWIRDKAKLISSTEDLGNDLAGVMALQRRLTGMERDLAAIQAKLDALQKEADKLAEEHPEEADAIRQKIAQIQDVWQELRVILKKRDEALGESGNLQRFLQDLDNFQAWLTQTQTAIASEDIPNNLAEAEKLMTQHAAIKEEIDGYEEDYAKMKEMGEKVTNGQTDAQYMFLRQRLGALDEGWEDLHKMWDNRQEMLSQCLNEQLFLRDAKQAEVLLAHQEHFLTKQDAPRRSGMDQNSLEAAESAVKKQEAFMQTMEANDEKINHVCQFANRLVDENHYAADKIKSKADTIQDRRDGNRKLADDNLEKLRDALQLQQFLQECDELGYWINEKLLTAQDALPEGTRNLHSKWQKHQAFMAELAANKDRLDKVHQNGDDLIREKPETADVVNDRLRQLQEQWDELENTTQSKAQKLFDANKAELFAQSCDDVDTWINDIDTQVKSEEYGHDLTSVNILLKRQQLLEKDVDIKRQQMLELQNQAEVLRNEGSIVDEVDGKRVQVEESSCSPVEARFSQLEGPLAGRRKMLEASKELHQFHRDVEDEKLWVAEKMPQATSRDHGNSLLNVQTLMKKNQSLRAEIDGHQPRIDEICERGQAMVSRSHPSSDAIEHQIEDMQNQWAVLIDEVDARKLRLEDSEKAQQYYTDVAEAEAWMSEQELYMMAEERAKDEPSANAMLKKHEGIENTIEDYAQTVHELSETSRNLIAENHPESDRIATRQAQIDKLYAGLKHLAEERRGKLDETLQLFQLNREVDDLEQWIAEREVVAGSHELGQDYEHVTMLQDRFREFARDTGNIGSERVAAANEICDKLIDQGHSDAATIAEWKDGLNEAWADLLELIDTRTQMLAASYELHKFYYDCKEVLGRIQEKQQSMSDELGRDAASVTDLQRKHTTFEADIQAIGSQVVAVQEDANRLKCAYAGDKAKQIEQREAEVLEAWNNLNMGVEGRKVKLGDTLDLHRFFNMQRDLMLWMEGIIRQINTDERPRDVSGVELLMDNHRSVEAEINARDESFAECIQLGNSLIERQHYASKDVEEKLVQLKEERKTMVDAWERRWDFLQIMLEVYQFARDATQAESWLSGQDAYLRKDNLGESVAEVEKLIKKHEAFEKSTGTQVERFTALERLTTLELREKKKTEEDEFRRTHPESPKAVSPPKSPASHDSDDEATWQPPAEAQAVQASLQQHVLESDPDAQHHVSFAEPGSPMWVEVHDTPVEDEHEPSHLDVSTDIDTDPETNVDTGAREEAQAVVDGEVAEPAKPSPEQQPVVNGEHEAAQEAAPSAEPVVNDSGEPGQAEPSMEGMLHRKHEWEAHAKKASNRSWSTVYTVLRDSTLSFHKDQKAFSSNVTFHGEEPVTVVGGTCEAATNYTKKKNVFRLKLANGGEYLFQAKDEDEMNFWIHKISSIADVGESKEPARAATYPPTRGEAGDSSPQAPERKKRGFFTLKKK